MLTNTKPSIILRSITIYATLSDFTSSGARHPKSNLIGVSLNYWMIGGLLKISQTFNISNIDFNITTLVFFEWVNLGRDKSN